MKPAPFEYLAPATIAETVAALAQHGDDAKVLAGGQSLVPMLNLRLARPAVLVDINGVTELDSLREADGRVHIGHAAAADGGGAARGGACGHPEPRHGGGERGAC